MISLEGGKARFYIERGDTLLNMHRNVLRNVSREGHFQEKIPPVVRSEYKYSRIDFANALVEKNDYNL
jgi:hypothetical protein